MFMFGKAMIAFFAALIFFPSFALAQYQNTVRAEDFAGNSVATKVTNAQILGCSPDTTQTCLLIIGPSLSKFTTGSMPSRLSYIIWCDYRDPNSAGLSAGGPCTGGAAPSLTLKAQRVTTGACVNTGCSVTLTWTVAFADADYTVTCSVEDSTAQSELTGLRVAKVRVKVAASVTVDIDNFSAGDITGTLNCMASHD